MLPVGELELVAYQDAHGWRPFESWFDRLDEPAARKVSAAVQRMAEGNLCDVKSVGAGVLERRINWGPGYRVYFGRDGSHVVILGDGTKQQQDGTFRRRVAGGQTTSTESSGFQAAKHK